MVCIMIEFECITYVNGMLFLMSASEASTRLVRAVALRSTPRLQSTYTQYNLFIY